MSNSFQLIADTPYIPGLGPAGTAHSEPRPMVPSAGVFGGGLKGDEDISSMDNMYFGANTSTVHEYTYVRGPGDDFREDPYQYQLCFVRRDRFFEKVMQKIYNLYSIGGLNRMFVLDVLENRHLFRTLSDVEGTFNFLGIVDVFKPRDDASRKSKDACGTINVVVDRRARCLNYWVPNAYGNTQAVTQKDQSLFLLIKMIPISDMELERENNIKARIEADLNRLQLHFRGKHRRVADDAHAHAELFDDVNDDLFEEKPNEAKLAERAQNIRIELDQKDEEDEAQTTLRGPHKRGRERDMDEESVISSSSSSSPSSASDSPPVANGMDVDDDEVDRKRAHKQQMFAQAYARYGVEYSNIKRCWAYVPWCSPNRDYPPEHLYTDIMAGWVGTYKFVGTSSWFHGSMCEPMIGDKWLNQYIFPQKPGDGFENVGKLDQIDVNLRK